jgi:lipoprotein-anchoring transpeptidase ErfK/SrfK
MSAEARRRFTERFVRFFGHGGGVAYYLIFGMLALTAASTALFADTVEWRLQREVDRMVLEGEADTLEGLQAGALAAEAAATKAEQDTAVPPDASYLVVSTAERKLWYKRGDEVLFSTEVATGSGKTLVREGGGSAWRFETPLGKLKVVSKEKDPVWAPPDWHYVEQARKRRAGLVRLERGRPLATSDGSVLSVSGDEVVRRYPDGRESVLQATDGGEIVVDGKVVVPPLGTSQRRYEGVLGAYRLNIGNGYALHGTNNPASIGQAVSHGCVRLRNEDIAKLYDLVAVGTPVYIY